MNQRRLVEAIFVLLGLLGLLAAALLKEDSVASGTLVNVAVVFLSVVILARLWAHAGGEPTANLLNDLANRLDGVKEDAAAIREDLAASRLSDHVGLRAIATRSDDYLTATAWRELLLGAASSVDLSGTAHHGWLRDTSYFKETVEAGIARGCRYRVLLYSPLMAGSPESHPLRSIVGEELDRTQATLGNNRAALRYYESLSRDLAAQGPGSFELRVVDSKVQYAILSRFDERILITPYLFHTRSEGSPLIDVSAHPGPNSLFAIYADEFEHLWTVRGRPLNAAEVTELGIQ